MVVMGIITLLATMGGYTWITLSNRAKATKITTDFRKIEGALQAWKAYTNGQYPNDGPTGSEIINFKNYPSIYPEYLSQIPVDSYQNTYWYDNDPEVAYDSNPSGCTEDLNGYNNVSGVTPKIESGVNVYLYTGTKYNYYIKIAAIIDKSVDSGDGACKGKFRWSLGPGRQNALFYLISPTS